MVACAEHVDYQLPNEHTRVTYLLDAIECNDPPLQAAIANIEEDTGDGTLANPGKRNDFELAVAALLPKDPVARKREFANKRGISAISSDANVEISAFGNKPGIGKSGVHLRWHSKKEFKKLTQDQMKELMKWREHKLSQDSNYDPKSEKGSKKESGGDKRRTKKEKKAFAAAVEKQVNNKLEAKLKEAKDEEQTEKDMRSYIMSLFQSSNSSNSSLSTKATTSATNATTSTSTKPQVTLRSILKRAKS